MINLTEACKLTTCSNVITIAIKGISYSYGISTYSPYNFTLYTNSGAKISSATIIYPIQNLNPKQSSLLIITSNSTTGSASNYNLTFNSSFPIDNLDNGGYIKIMLPNQPNYSNSVCNIGINTTLTFSLYCVL